MYIIAAANGKGGVGKTTTVANLAINFTKRGYYTFVLDTDPLACLEDWWEARKAQDLQLMSISIEKLPEAIPKLKQAGVDILIIDTPGFIANAVNDVLQLSDLVMILSKAGPLDLRATNRSLKFIKHIETPKVFVLNEVKPKTRIASEAVIALSQYGKVCPSIIHSRNDFVVSMIDGQTLEEIAEPDNKGIEEVDKLGDYILEQLGENHLKRVDRTPPEAKPASAQVVAFKPGKPGKAKA